MNMPIEVCVPSRDDLFYKERITDEDRTIFVDNGLFKLDTIIFDINKNSALPVKTELEEEMIQQSTSIDRKTFQGDNEISSMSEDIVEDYNTTDEITIFTESVPKATHSTGKSESLDNSVQKRVFSPLYHQQGFKRV